MRASATNSEQGGVHDEVALTEQTTRTAAREGLAKPDDDIPCARIHTRQK